MSKLIVNTIEAQTYRYDSDTTGLTLNSDGRVTKPNQIHFHVRPTSSISLTEGNDHQTIIMDVAVRNIGNGYSTSTGIFTAPIAGVYLFTANIRYDGAASGGYVRTMIINAGTGSPDTSPWNDYNGTFSAIDGSGHSTNYQTISCTAIMYCNANDKVYLQGGHNSDSALSVHTESQYSGVLIG
jgi:hypothetical protein